MHPEIFVNLDAISFNSSEILRTCAARGVAVDAVLKGVCGDPAIARAVMEGGIASFMDSRMKNIVRMKASGISARMGLLRIPMISELDLMLEHCDWALVSMPRTIRLIDQKCRNSGKKFEVLLMADLGDLREGILPGQIPEAAEALKECKGVTCIGLGTNLGCFGGVLPSREKMEELISLANELRAYLNAEKWLISAGGTQVFHNMTLFGTEVIPEGITHIRPGGALLRGMSQQNEIQGLRKDTMNIAAEYIEIITKPSKPSGDIDVDAFGKIPYFDDRGKRKRAIVALGRQDVVIEDLKPLRGGIEILGGSSDHMILDVEALREAPELGEIETFSFVRYGGMLQAFTSEFVGKRYIRDGASE